MQHRIVSWVCRWAIATSIGIVLGCALALGAHLIEERLVPTIAASELERPFDDVPLQRWRLVRYATLDQAERGCPDGRFASFEEEPGVPETAYYVCPRFYDPK